MFYSIPPAEAGDYWKEVCINSFFELYSNPLFDGYHTIVMDFSPFIKDIGILPGFSQKMRGLPGDFSWKPFLYLIKIPDQYIGVLRRVFTDENEKVYSTWNSWWTLESTVLLLNNTSNV